MQEKIAVIGLGYVGLPLALAFGRAFKQCVGFDINTRRVEALAGGLDTNTEVPSSELRSSSVTFSSDPADLKGSTFFVVGVPTPIDDHKQPDLTPLQRACELVGPALTRGAVVVFESTVYPGVTEDFCGPLLERGSGLKAGTDFKLGYSPERINPGDKEHTLERICKVVSGQDPETLERVAAVYGKIITAGVHRAQSIKVAEAAKVIENTQRDLNIALMNELSIIFDRMGLRTKDVLDAAATKWNFLRFTPGLVGGHCIGVDPYYLTSKAEQLGYHPQVILAGRRINDGMGVFIAQRTVKLMINAGLSTKGARVLVLGLSFKENISDVRNSRVPDIVHELEAFGVQPLVHDPHVDRDEARHEYGIELITDDALGQPVEAVILAVSHRKYLDAEARRLFSGLTPGGVIVDVKCALDHKQLPSGSVYWSL
ncbi:MAG: nucleotide sugar dehydrogenase [Oligoflexia bacterium]|nr:nucleotide sugar dehydrogenase [Oligoflexia bacterium]